MSKIITIVSDDNTESCLKPLAGTGMSKSKIIRLAVQYAMANAKEFKAWLDKGDK